MTGSASAPKPLGVEVAVIYRHSQELDLICDQKTWSEAADQLLRKIRRSSTQRDWSSSTNTSVGSSDAPEIEGKSRVSPIANAAERLLSRFKRYMGRRSQRETFSGKRSRPLTEYDTREFGFETISGEIERAIRSTSSTTSLYLQEITQIRDTTDIAIFHQHGRSQLISIDEFTTVARACQLFDPNVDLCTMQLYEEIHELPGFARPMEDHEIIFKSAMTWATNSPGSHFRLLENPNKFTALTEDNVLGDRSLSLTSLQEEPNNDDEVNLMFNNRHSIVDWCPDPNQRRNNSSLFVPTYVTSGVLWFRSPGRSWRKMFCFLHGSAMFYSLKRRCKSARYMRLLLDLSMVDIFYPISTAFQLPFRAPTNELIVCKPSASHRFDVKNLTVFATRTPEGRIAWQNGIRIHKFGIARLEANFQTAMPSDGHDRAAHRNLTPEQIPAYTN